MDPLMIVGGVVVVAAIGISIYPAMKIMPFVYGSTRVKAARGKIFKDSELSAFAGEGYKEIVYQMEKRGQTGLLNLIDDDFRIEKVQTLLSRERRKVMRKLVSYVPEKFKPFFKQMLVKYDLEFIFMVLRSKTNKFNATHKLSGLYHETEFMSETEIAKVDEMSVDDFLIALKKTPYAPFVNNHMETIKAGDLEEFEKELHKYYFDGLRRFARSNTYLQQYIALEIDLYNIRHALSRDEEFMIKGGKINKNIIASIGSAKDEKELQSAFDKTHFGKFIKSYNKTADILNGLFKARKQYGKTISYKEPLGINQILSYSLEKDIELKNLSILTTLVSEEFSPEEIRALLI